MWPDRPGLSPWAPVDDVSAMTTTPPIGPWQIAQYLKTSAAITPPRPPAAEPALQARRVDSVEIGPAGKALVAQRVPGSVDFAPTTPPPSGPALPFYRHPADRNAAATSITAGRVLNLEG